MTSTSFNPIQMNTQQPTTNQSLTFKQDQVFHGTIKKLYPDQMAEIQVGGQKLMAKLEMPLKVGDAHFFQVTNTNPQTELKVVSGPMSQTMTPTQQMNQLLETMNLPKTSEMRQVLSHFMKEQLPISKEQLVAAESWMKKLPEGVLKNDALQALQRMVELKMPFTNTVFQALTQGAKTDGMSVNLANLAQLLATQQGGNDALKMNLLQQIQQLAKPLDAETGGVLLSRSMQSLMDSSAAISVKLQALTVLKGAGILPQNATLQNWQSIQQPSTTQPLQSQQSGLPQQVGQMIQQLAQTSPEQMKPVIEQLKAWVANENLLNISQKEQIQQLIGRFSQIPMSKQSIEVFTKQLQEQLVKAFTDNSSSRLFTQDERGMTVKDQLLSLIKPDSNLAVNDSLLRNLVKVSANSPQSAIQSALIQAEAQVKSAADSKAMEQAIKTVLKGLGVSYEATLSSKAGDIQAIANQIKPQLLALVQDLQTPPALRDAADTVLARMNGMQLLSGENGHQHQIVMQVPLEFFGKRMDATLQWNGRMKDDGKIDANFARILFYLNMESLEQTVIDMQVQNRVVTINVFNDHPSLEQLAIPLKETLKRGLTEKEYHLSGIFIKPFEDQTQKVATKNPIQPEEQQGGVDIRV
ncbi:hypothetical protein CSE16_04360 [Solibacillus sp. R5-41]|uniref:hypothetical protein n=1 Tax=Solibacillus sp. R5-41 TaxID=2048654 RepID=UPI000C12603A|nr:hypothetical protein [Solibacillus sp. R5-41]ATP39335.1 hypothetical protein CSE16_04360 [Solibacillus sp. R5-41]